MKDPKSKAGKPAEKSVALGQVFTPMHTAEKMILSLFETFPNSSSSGVSILDPSSGPGTFYLATQRQNLISYVDDFVSYDIDNEMIEASRKMLTTSNVRLFNKDYLEDFHLKGSFDLAILNPPYIRQEWIDKKKIYRTSFKKYYNLSVPGTSNLYVYFITKVVRDLKVGGNFVCIVYDSWQSTKYGKWLKAYLELTCKNIKIEAVHNQPFADKLIDATIISGEKVQDADDSDFIKNSIDDNTSIFDIQGFDSIGSLLEPKRGLRLKQVNFFMAGSNLIDSLGSTRFIKKVSKISGYSVEQYHSESALIITRENYLPKVYDEIERRLRNALENPDKNVSILTWHKERPLDWYIHSEPPKASILFNYYLRKRPRHIFSPEIAYSDNFYGISNLRGISALAWLAILNSTCACVEILAHSRNQGGGLAKLQLFEYRRTNIPDLTQCSTLDIKKFESLGAKLIKGEHSNVIDSIDELISSIYSDSRLNKPFVQELFDEVDNRARRPKEKHTI